MSRFHILTVLLCLCLLVPAAPVVGQDEKTRISSSNAAQLTQILQIDAEMDYVRSVSWSPDSRHIAAGGKGRMVVLSAATGEPVAVKSSGPATEVVNVAWSPDGTKIARVDNDLGTGISVIYIWDLTADTSQLIEYSYTVTQISNVHSAEAHSVSWSPDSTRIATVGSDGDLRIWEAATGNLLETMEGSVNSRSSIAWGMSETLIASATEGNGTQIWDTGYSQELAVMPGHTESVTSVAWSPVGVSLATASEDDTVIVTDLTATSGGEIVLRGHENDVNAITWSPDGSLLVSGGRDRTARVWEATSGAQLAVLNHEDSVASVAWSPDGSRIVTGSWDGTVRVWGVGTVSGDSSALPTISPPPLATGNTTTFTEEFNDPYAFTQTSENVRIVDGKVYWNVSRNGGEQYVYRSIPAFSGNMRLTVTGQVTSWDNNCIIRAGVGDDPGRGVDIDFGWIGGGCPGSDPNYPPGTFVTVSGVARTDFGQEADCSSWGNWLMIQPNQNYTAQLTITDSGFTLDVPNSTAGRASGEVAYTGVYDTLYVGLSDDGGWPSCSGTIDSIMVEPLGSQVAPQGSVPIYVGHMGAGSMEYGISSRPDLYRSCNDLQAQFSANSPYAPLAIFIDGQYQPDASSTYGVVDADSDPWEVMVFYVADVVNACPGLNPIF